MPAPGRLAVAGGGGGAVGDQPSCFCSPQTAQFPGSPRVTQASSEGRPCWIPWKGGQTPQGMHAGGSRVPGVSGVGLACLLALPTECPVPHHCGRQAASPKSSGSPQPTLPLRVPNARLGVSVGAQPQENDLEPHPKSLQVRERRGHWLPDPSLLPHFMRRKGNCGSRLFWNLPGVRLHPPWVVDDGAGAACQGWMQERSWAARHGCRGLPAKSLSHPCLQCRPVHAHVVNRTGTG